MKHGAINVLVTHVGACWGMLEAMICIDIIGKVREKRFWKREKFWQEEYASDVVEQIVKPIEKKIEEVMENNR